MLISDKFRYLRNFPDDDSNPIINKRSSIAFLNTGKLITFSMQSEVSARKKKLRLKVNFSKWVKISEQPFKQSQRCHPTLTSHCTQSVLQTSSLLTEAEVQVSLRCESTDASTPGRGLLKWIENC